MNMRGVFLHVLADALGSVIVIISALIMWLADQWEGRKYVDPGELSCSSVEGSFTRLSTYNCLLYFYYSTSCVKFTPLSSALSLCLVALMLRSVWPLLIESALILLQTVPTHIEVRK